MLHKAVDENVNESLWLYLQTTARERTKEISGLKGKIADLDRQLSQMKALKEKTERERESAKGAGAVTEVMHAYICYIWYMHTWLVIDWCDWILIGFFNKSKLKECQSELETEKKHHQLASDKVKAKNVCGTLHKQHCQIRVLCVGCLMLCAYGTYIQRDLDKLREDLQRKDNDLWKMTKEKEKYQGQAEAGSTTVKSQQVNVHMCHIHHPCL